MILLTPTFFLFLFSLHDVHSTDGSAFDDEKIHFATQTGYPSLIHGFEPYTSEPRSLIIGDIVNVSNQTVSNVIVGAKVFTNGIVVTESNNRSIKYAMMPGEASPFHVRIPNTGWDCFEVRIDSYETTENIISNQLSFVSSDIGKRGLHEGRLKNTSEESASFVRIYAIKYDSDGKMFGIVSEPMGEPQGNMSPGHVGTFWYPAHVPGFESDSDSNNFQYAKPANYEFIASGSPVIKDDVVYEMSTPYTPKYVDLNKIKQSSKKYSSCQLFPDWIKQTIEFWVTDQTNDDTKFVQAIEYLIQNGIISIYDNKPIEEDIVFSVPVWIKTNAEFWINDDISDDEFLVTLEWLINSKIIQI